MTEHILKKPVAIRGVVGILISDNTIAGRLAHEWDPVICPDEVLNRAGDYYIAHHGSMLFPFEVFLRAVVRAIGDGKPLNLAEIRSRAA